MSSAQIDEAIQAKLRDGHDCIALAILQGRAVWLIDWEAHFNLDHDKNLQAYADKGLLSLEELDAARRNFRGGFTTLAQDNIAAYLASGIPKIVTSHQLAGLLFDENKGEYSKLSDAIQTTILTGKVMPTDMISLCNRVSMLLPKFYINFDRSIFIHMVSGRSYDNVVPPNWYGAESDFEHMVPVSERYWQRDLNEDFWAVKNI